MFVIDTPQGFVAGFSEQHQMVQFTEVELRRMQFSTKEQAQQWIDRHGDVEHGLESVGARIVTLQRSVKAGAAAKAFHNPSKRVL